MAKIKISELASEIGCESKELIAFLQENGIEAKRSNSSIEETDAEVARKNFGKKAAKAEASEKPAKEEKPEKAKEEAEPKKEEAPKAEAPKADKAPKAEAPKEEAPKAVDPSKVPPKKKKKIIVVTNSNMGRNGQGGQPQGGNRNFDNQRRDNRNNGQNGQGQRRTFAQSQNVYHPIKPLTAPSQLDSYNTPVNKSVTPKPAAPKKEAPVQAPVQAQEKPQVQQPAPQRENRDSRPAPVQNDNRNNDRPVRPERQDRNQDRNQGRPDRGGFASRNDRGPSQGPDRNNQGGNKFAGKNDNRFGGNKFDRNAGGRGGFDGPAEKQGPGRRDDDRRRAGQEKDKRNKKDLAYEQEEMMPRSKRVGRFIKPEVKKVEEPEEQIKVISIPEKVSIKELAEKMKMQPSVIIKKLFMAGQVSTVNTELTYEEAENIAIEYDIICEKEVPVDIIEELLKEDEDAPETLKKRPPVVCVMGHVDHGKTSLLDYVRNTNVIAGEAGGITQHIGAYNVRLEDGRRITFLDTPGHEAFTAMRARGTQVTDIAIIIIAADDSIMPTTKEAIAHAQAANVPMVFAINKIDKPGANPDKIRQDLAAMNLLVEEWGGKYQCQEISAKKGIGVEELMEKVLLEAEMLDLKANPNRKATGSVIESSLDKGRGYVSTVLVSNGTLHVGDIVIAGTAWGRVKAMFNERNQNVEAAKPAEPVIILGLNGAPQAGDSFHIMETEQEAKTIANKRLQLQREQSLRTTKILSLEEIAHRVALGEFHELNLVVKADTQGSVEALSDSFIKMSTEKVQVNVIMKAVGQISENDVMLASTAENGMIVGFQVRPSAAAKKLAEQEGVEINTYSVIYDAMDDIKAAMEGMLDKVKKEVSTGQVEVKEVFKISKVGAVAGCMVTDGKVHAKDKARLIRDGIVIFTGEINALKRYKDDVKEVATGFECGISLVNFNDIQAGDVIETFTEIEVEQKL